MKSSWHILAGIVFSIGIFAYGVDLADRFNWFKPDRHKLEMVYNKTFSNEVVSIGGKDFINCTFANVTFHFDGGNFAFEKPTITGTVSMDTNNDDIENGIWLLKYLDSVAPGLLAKWEKKEKK